MKTLRILYHLARSDFLERTRRYSFWVTLLFVIALTYFFVPALNAPIYPILVMGGYRPIYNSAWIGVMVTLLMTEFMLLFGFYMVKNTIERDRQTGVGEIIATTPISRVVYTLGKWLSNVAVFAAMTGIILLASIILQWVRGEDLNINFWALAGPFGMVLLPAFAVVAAVAVMFECIPWLRGGFGNVAYVVVYGGLVALTDIQGVGVLWPGIYQTCLKYSDHCNPVRQIDIAGGGLTQLLTFRYEGPVWSVDILMGRLGYVLAAVTIAALAAVFFHRFDPARVGNGLFSSLFSFAKGAVLQFIVESPVEDKENEIVDAVLTQPALAHKSISSLPPVVRLSGIKLYLRLLESELRLTFKGVNPIWYVGALGLVIAAFAVPMPFAHLVVLPLSWVWPLFRWSALGNREIRYNTSQIVFCGPHPLRRQLLTQWLVGVLISVVMGFGILLRLALAGEWVAAVATGVGALFVPSLALAMGCLSGGSKLFEAAYLFFWYLVSVQTVVFLDFMGRFAAMNAAGLPWIYAVITVGLFILALLCRHLQIRQ